VDCDAWREVDGEDADMCGRFVGGRCTGDSDLLDIVKRRAQSHLAILPGSPKMGEPVRAEPTITHYIITWKLILHNSLNSCASMFLW
jgi:hypothetical protein